VRKGQKTIPGELIVCLFLINCPTTGCATFICNEGHAMRKVFNFFNKFLIMMNVVFVLSILLFVQFLYGDFGHYNKEQGTKMDSAFINQCSIFFSQTLTARPTRVHPVHTLCATLQTDQQWSSGAQLLWALLCSGCCALVSMQ
jgi:hypothetical protein